MDVDSPPALVLMEETFKACSDRTRLRILNLLVAEEEVCVCFLVEVFGTNQPKISRHLAYLKKAGLVDSRKEGLWVYYRLSKQLSGQTQKILDCLTECFMEVEELGADIQKLRLIGNRVGTNGKASPALELSSGEDFSGSSEIEIELL
jgi:ArsR family transcriptional regulator, arsenate/arsenite/antimonite-responsive transcriptional repressor